jgi:hypothetical protein
MKQILALLLLSIGAKAHAHIMLGQNIQQFDEALGTPITQEDGKRKYKWGSDRWLFAYFDSNGTFKRFASIKRARLRVRRILGHESSDARR